MSAERMEDVEYEVTPTYHDVQKLVALVNGSPGYGVPARLTDYRGAEPALRAASDGDVVVIEDAAGNALLTVGAGGVTGTGPAAFGATTASSLAVTGAATVGGTLGVTGAATATGGVVLPNGVALSGTDTAAAVRTLAQIDAANQQLFGSGGGGVAVLRGGGVKLNYGAATTRVEVDGTGLGFFGGTPVGRGNVGAAATDLASVITLANNIRTLLRALNLSS